MARDVGREQQWMKRLAAVGEWLEAVENGHGTEGLHEASIRDIRIRLASESDPGVLIIVRAFDDRGKWVGFVGGLDACTALLTWRQKDRSGGLKWSVDKPWDGGA